MEGDMMIIPRHIKAELINDENNSLYNNTAPSHVDYIPNSIHLEKNINSVPLYNNNDISTEFSKYAADCQYSEDGEINDQSINTDDTTCQLKIIAVYSEADLAFDNGEENHIREGSLGENFRNVKSEVISSEAQEDNFENEGFGVFNVLPDSQVSPIKKSILKPKKHKRKKTFFFTSGKAKRKRCISPTESLETMSPENQFPEAPSPILPSEEMISTVRPLTEMNVLPPDNSSEPLRRRRKRQSEDHRKGVVTRVRRKRCGVCGPCQVTENCNVCRFCLNRKALKQACIEKQCVYLKFKKSAVEQSLQKLIEKEKEVAEAIQEEMNYNGNNHDTVVEEEHVHDSSTAYHDNNMAAGLVQRHRNTSYQENLRPDIINISATGTGSNYGNEQTDNLMHSVPEMIGSSIPSMPKPVGHSISNSFEQPVEQPINFIHSKAVTETLYFEYKKRFDAWFQNTFQSSPGLSMTLPPPPPPPPELQATRQAPISPQRQQLSLGPHTMPGQPPSEPHYPGHPEQYSHLYSMWFEHLKSQRCMNYGLPPEFEQLPSMPPQDHAPLLPPPRPPPPPRCRMPCCSPTHPTSDRPQQTTDHSFMQPPTLNSVPRFPHDYRTCHPANGFSPPSQVHPGMSQVHSLGTWIPPYPVASSSSICPSVYPSSIPRQPYSPHHSEYPHFGPPYTPPASMHMQESSFVQRYPDQRFPHDRTTQSVNQNLSPTDQTFLLQYPRFIPPSVPQTISSNSSSHINKTHPKDQSTREANRKSPSSNSAINSSLLNQCHAPQPLSSVQKEKHEELPLPLSVHGIIKLDDLDIDAVVSMDKQNSIKVKIVPKKCQFSDSVHQIKRTRHASSNVNRTSFEKRDTKKKRNHNKDLAVGRTFQIVSNVGVKQVWGIDRTFELEIPGSNLSVENVELSDDLLSLSSNKDELLSFISIQKNSCKDKFWIADEASASLHGDKPDQHPKPAKHKTQDEESSAISNHIASNISPEKSEPEMAEEEGEEEEEEGEERHDTGFPLLSLLPKLPDNFASSLVEAIAHIKEQCNGNHMRVQENQIYGAEIDEKLLEIEKKTYQFGPKMRLGIFRHISTFLPAHSEPLYKCVKKIRFHANQAKLMTSLSNLKESLIQVSFAKGLLETECNFEQMYRPGARSNSKIRALLIEAILNKMQMYTVAKSKHQSPERFLLLFLRRIIADNPQLSGFTVDKLYRWSSAVHDPWTNHIRSLENDRPTDGSLMAAKGYYMQIAKLSNTQHKDNDCLLGAKHDHNRNNINGNSIDCHTDNIRQLPNGVNRPERCGAKDIFAIRDESQLKRTELTAQNVNNNNIRTSAGFAKDNVSKNVLSSLSAEGQIRDQKISALNKNLSDHKGSPLCNKTKVDNKFLIDLLQSRAKPCPSSDHALVRVQCDKDIENCDKDVNGCVSDPTITSPKKKMSRNKHFLLDYLHTLKQSQ